MPTSTRCPTPAAQRRGWLRWPGRGGEVTAYHHDIANRHLRELTSPKVAASRLGRCEALESTLTQGNRTRPAVLLPGSRGSGPGSEGAGRRASRGGSRTRGATGRWPPGGVPVAARHQLQDQVRDQLNITSRGSGRCWGCNCRPGPRPAQQPPGGVRALARAATAGPGPDQLNSHLEGFRDQLGLQLQDQARDHSTATWTVFRALLGLQLQGRCATSSTTIWRGSGR